MNINMKSSLNMRRFLSFLSESAKHLMVCDKAKPGNYFPLFCNLRKRMWENVMSACKYHAVRSGNPRSPSPDRRELTSTGHSQSTRQVQRALFSEKCPSFPGTHANRVLILDNTTSKHIRNLETLIFPLSDCWTGRPVKKNCSKRFRN